MPGNIVGFVFVVAPGEDEGFELGSEVGDFDGLVLG